MRERRARLLSLDNAGGPPVIERAVPPHCPVTCRPWHSHASGSAALVLAAGLVLFTFGPLAGQTGSDGRGTVAGQVTEASAGGPLPGALLRIDGLVLETATDSSGAFRLAPVPAGTREIEVSYFGFQPYTMTVEVPAGGTVRLPRGNRGQRSGGCSPAPS